jgi:hypothetical protein
MPWKGEAELFLQEVARLALELGVPDVFEALLAARPWHREAVVREGGQLLVQVVGGASIPVMVPGSRFSVSCPARGPWPTRRSA